MPEGAGADVRGPAGMEFKVLVSTLILVFPIAMIIAALTDLFTFKIPMLIDAKSKM